MTTLFFIKSLHLYNENYSSTQIEYILIRGCKLNMIELQSYYMIARWNCGATNNSYFVINSTACS